ncbi:hypothetical protein TcYC6_0020140 [Trypanosoma cruzi]|nr:hypothetical protein TcYC6_0020140 [Trypanosoma cruzi]
MSRGGRHAGGAHTAPNGIQCQPRNSPDYYYFGNCGGDDGGSLSPSCHLHWVSIDVWIDDIRIAGSKSDATLWEVQVLRNADGRHATMEEDLELGATQYTFLWMRFGHSHQAVSLSDNFVRCVCAMPLLKYLTISEMEVVASRFLYAAAILGTRLCAYCFHIKAVRRRLSAVNRGIVQETSPANFRRQRLVWARDYDTSSRK